MATGPVLGFQKIEGKHSDRVNQMVKDTIDRLKEVYGESVPQPILDQIEYITRDIHVIISIFNFTQTHSTNSSPTAYRNIYSMHSSKFSNIFSIFCSELSYFISLGIFNDYINCHFQVL